jgi:hypothetical protein
MFTRASIVQKEWEPTADENGERCMFFLRMRMSREMFLAFLLHTPHAFEFKVRKFYFVRVYCFYNEAWN